MREDICVRDPVSGASSRPMWETLEGMVREKAQEFIQQIMEEEVTELLGRREVRAQEYGGLGRGLPQRIWKAEAVGDELVLRHRGRRHLQPVLLRDHHLEHGPIRHTGRTR